MPSKFKNLVRARMAKTGESWATAARQVRAQAPAEASSVSAEAPVALCVTDTNVYLDIYSCHDLIATYDALHSKLGAATIDDPEVTYRLARARESLLLALYFNKVGATTFSLHKEAVELLVQRAPPAPGGATMESDFTTFFIHFVKDYVLPAWNPIMPTEPGDAMGKKADALLIETAKERGLPLITNEGYTRAGIVDEKMRKLAKGAGVAVFSPKEFYAGKIDEDVEVASFLRRLREQAPHYLADRGVVDKANEVLMWIEGYYRMVLLGEVNGRATPARVTVVGSETPARATARARGRELDDERYVREVLTDLHGVRLRKVREATSRTFDFELLSGDEPIAAIEVKRLAVAPRTPENGWTRTESGFMTRGR